MYYLYYEGVGMVEIAAAVSMATSAYNGIKRAIEMGREAQDVASAFGKFFDAKESIAEASVEHREGSKVKKLFSGTSVEAQALEITAAKHKTMQLEKELREFLLYSGQSQFYEDMMIERRRIRDARIAEARRRAAKQAMYIDGSIIGVSVIGTFVFVMWVVNLIVGASA